MKKNIFSLIFVVFIAGLTINTPLNAMERRQDQKYDNLYTAIKSDNAKRVNFLLELGVNVNRQSTVEGFMGVTPLHYAAALGRNEIIQILLDNGAAQNIGDTNGRTPFDFAVLSGNKQTLKIFIQRITGSSDESDISTEDPIAEGCYASTPSFLEECKEKYEKYKKKYWKPTKKFATKHYHSTLNYCSNLYDSWFSKKR